MTGLCGADCSKCPTKEACRGCGNSCGSPFGGKCFVKDYIKKGGKEKYSAFKQKLLDEINALLEFEGIPKARELFELKGEYVNLAYPLPNSKKCALLNDNDIYLGTQIEFGEMGTCCGVVAGLGFILVCSYGLDGSDTEIMIYKRR